MRPNETAKCALETPFLEAYAWRPDAGLPETRIESPFVNAYAEESLFEGVNPDAEEIRSVLAELHDTEFDEALFELADEASSLAERTSSSYDASAGAARFLESWVEPLRAESEALFDNLADAFAHVPLSSLRDSEIEQMVDDAAIPGRPLEPAFEQFFGKLIKKAKAAVKSVANVAKKGIALAQKLSPVNLLLGKLKGLIMPLLRKVLQMALNKIPAALRPAASTLAKKLLGSGAVVAEPASEMEASPEFGSIQRELDETVVNLMFAGDDNARELMLLEATDERGTNETAALDVSGLEVARDRFVNDIARVEAQSVEPVMEQFIPAILPALRLGLKLIGRPRVVSVIAGLIGKLIGPLVGGAATPALSKAIADTGLKLMSLEAPEQETALGPYAIAATVEDTVRRVCEASDEVLEDSRLLEAEVVDAFHRAAGAHLPARILHPDKRESSTAAGTWVLMPKRGYKKYTRVFETELTGELARSVHTFGGSTLESFLRDRMRMDMPVRARVHLYEAIPGTWVSRVVRGEKALPGMGNGRRGAWELFHPLTTHNATALLREPGLGRDLSPKYTASPRQLAVGQRLFHLEIPGAPARPLARGGRVDVVADFPKNELRLSVFLAERQAQNLAQQLNAGTGLASVLASFKEPISTGVRRALGGKHRGRVRIVHEAVDHDGLLGGALGRLGSVLLERFSDKVCDWAMKAVADYLQHDAASFVSAVQDPSDGVTLRIVLQGPPGFGALRTLLRGKGGLGPGDPASLFKGAPAASVSVVPGFSA